MAGRLRETELRITVEVFSVRVRILWVYSCQTKVRDTLLSLRIIVLAGVGNLSVNLFVYRLRGHTPRVCKARSVLLAHTTCAADGTSGVIFARLEHLLDPCAPGAHYLFHR